MGVGRGGGVRREKGGGSLVVFGVLGFWGFGHPTAARPRSLTTPKLWIEGESVSSAVSLDAQTLRISVRFVPNLSC